MRNVGLGAVVAVAMLLGVPAVASADTFTVNDDDAPGDAGPGGTCGLSEFTTINDALDLATDDDVIRVCAGTYNESVGTTEDVTFLGAQAGVDARTRAVPDAEESIVTADNDTVFALGGVEVVLDGFKIVDNPSGPGVGLFGLGETVANNIIANNSGGGLIGDGFGATIRRNHFNDNNVGIGGEVALALANSTEIDDNLFEGEGFASIVTGFEGSGENVTITDNEVNGAGVIAVLSGTDVQVARNVITDPVSLGGVFVASSINVDVTRNTISNPLGDGAGISVIDIGDGQNAFVDITRNTMLGNGDEAGILVGFFAHDGTLDVHFNRIAGNSVGIFADDGNLVDAENNWFGCNEGPEGDDCDPVVVIPDSQVDFDPWLVMSATADPDSIGAGGQTSQITADVLTNSDGDTVPPDFPDGAQVDFATDLGAVDPLFDLTEGAIATTTLTSGAETGTANVDSTLDAETVTTPVEITEETNPPACAERIDGTAQNDNLTGTDGSELIRGRGGRDRVDGLGGDDCVKGGAGPDKVIGGPGEDRARGGAGDDTVKARDGEADVVRCGAGDDVAKVNPGDNVRGCEKVKGA